MVSGGLGLLEGREEKKTKIVKIPTFFVIS
jgi:hypothetical protein